MESSRIEQIGKLLSPGMDIRTTSIPAGDIDDTIDDTMDVIIQEILIGMRLPEIRRVVANILKEKTGTEWTIQVLRRLL